MPGHLIRRLHQISTSVFQMRVSAAGHDLTPVQFAAMTAIEERPGLDQASLAGLIAIDKATAGGVVDRLQQKGLVDRRISTRDRRARELRLTASGNRVLDRVAPVVAALQAEILGSLSEDERSAFVMLAQKATSAGNALSRAPLVAREQAPQD